jgi:hypothetical protein
MAGFQNSFAEYLGKHRTTKKGKPFVTFFIMEMLK